jgi:hypothetical protein
MLEESSISERDPLEESSIESDRGTFIVKFGLLLLQIECRQKLQLSKDEKLDELGPEMALEHYFEELNGDIEGTFHHVMRACLDFNQCVEQICHPSVTDDLKCPLGYLQTNSDAP